MGCGEVVLSCYYYCISAVVVPSSRESLWCIRCYLSCLCLSLSLLCPLLSSHDTTDSVLQRSTAETNWKLASLSLFGGAELCTITVFVT